MYALRDYQRAAVDAAWDWLRSHRGNAVLCLPTGAGKSLVIAELCREAVTRWSGRVAILAHRKELLEQNAEKIRALLPGLDIGIHSAGLGRRDTDHAVLVAGIQSVYRRAADIGARHLVLIDEAHLVPFDGEGMYRTFLTELRSYNPRLRLVGLTATPYRLDVGPLCRPDGLFQRVAYTASIPELIAGGYLCPLVSRAAAESVDTSALHIRGGEFVAHEEQALFSETAVVKHGCREIALKCSNRRSVIVFCSGVHHAVLVRGELERLVQQRVAIVTGESLPIERAETLGAFKAGVLRWLVNVDVLTHGFDAPNIDAIAVLRATMSPGLFAQICGRGFRVSPGKENCLVLDFGANIERHGALDSPEYGAKTKDQSHPGEAPAKSCPNCQTETLIQARECEVCGFAFPVREGPRHDSSPDEQRPILSAPEVWLVGGITYSRHEKKKDPEAPPTLRVDYHCQPADGTGGNLEYQTISEWVCIEHEGYARKKASAWWQKRSVEPMPATVNEAVRLAQCGALASAARITTQQDGRWRRVVAADLDEIPEVCGEAGETWETQEEELAF